MISQLEISNFKCFRSKSIELKNFTVLAGANGAGKSTVIQALLLVRQTIEKLRRNDIALSDDDTKSICVNLNGPYGLVLGNSQAVVSASSDLGVFSISVTAGVEEYSFHYNAPTTRPEQSISMSNVEEIEGKSFGSSCGSVFSNTFSYLSAERLGPRVVQDIPPKDTMTTGVSGEYVGYAMYRAADKLVDSHRCIDRQASKLFHLQLESWLDLIMPGVQVKAQTYDEIGKVQIGIRKAVSETEYLIPSNIGFGISYVLPILVAGLSVPKGSMLVIENPEAHLHPAGQTSIGKFLARIAGSGVQVIVETHSEHIINGARIAVLENVIESENVLVNYFDSSSSEPIVSPIRIDMKGELSYWPSGFFDQQEKDLLTIFQLRKNA